METTNRLKNEKKIQNSFFIRKILRQAKIPWYRVKYKLLNEQDFVRFTRAAGELSNRFDCLKIITDDIHMFFDEFI